MPALVPDRARSGLAFGLAALDCHGRVNDRLILAMLGWVGGQRLAVREESGLIVVAADSGGAFRVTRQGQDVNTAPARLRGPGERANAELKSWKVHRMIRSSPNQAGPLINAVQTLILAN
ncbi:hypothetical protein [Cryptosporangium arvum]|uniref:Transposase n=1 Tax=Cryptosporangium arvum DSM 44712 TaxID=927661 RepID=A0A011AJ65_9ACTN|nr:hypothetical protein [Cryptosporangium arvum]EXG82071.1 hypothetical protein CryarDRAFT_3208 [Cryptosporangium arvum DSM 44712]